MIDRYSPQTSRRLAARAMDSSVPLATRKLAVREFRKYHSAERMSALAAHVEFLHDMAHRARAILHDEDVGDADVRRLIQLLERMDDALLAHTSTVH